MVQEHCVARGGGCVSDGIGHVQLLFCGDNESHAIVPVGVVDLEAQLGVRDSIRKVPQYGFILLLEHFRVDRESLAGGAQIIQCDGKG